VFTTDKASGHYPGRYDRTIVSSCIKLRSKNVIIMQLSILDTMIDKYRRDSTLGPLSSITS
jgi:hypothetical protein